MIPTASLVALDALNTALRDLCDAHWNARLPELDALKAKLNGTPPEPRKSYRITDAPRSAEAIHD